MHNEDIDLTFDLDENVMSDSHYLIETFVMIN